jgi:hypothetical protein
VYRWSRSKRHCGAGCTAKASGRPGLGIGRKTVRRHIAAAIELGVERSGSEEQLGASRSVSAKAGELLGVTPAPFSLMLFPKPNPG